MKLEFEGGEEEAEAPAPEEKKQEAGGEEPSASEGSQVCNMPEGAYLLHVLIETGKNIQLEGEDTVDPMVKVIFCGKDKTSSAK